MNSLQLIRLAKKADLADLHAIERAASALFPEGRVPEVDEVMPMEELERALENGLLYVVTWRHVVVGFAMARKQDGFSHLAVMAVHPHYERRGLGRQLVSEAVYEAARRGWGGVTLTTFSDLPWNGPFYRKAGFRVLSNSELSPVLREILAQEEKLGMVKRVAMRYAIGD